MDVIERILEIIAYKELTVSSFARKIGVGDQTIRGIVVQRRNKPGYEVIAKIIQTFDWLNPEWLITGNGEMLKAEIENKSENNPQMSELIKYLKEKDEKIERLIAENAKYKLKYEMITGSTDVYSAQPHRPEVNF